MPLTTARTVYRSFTSATWREGEPPRLVIAARRAVRIWCSRDRGGGPFDPKTINDRAKRAWATATEREVELAEREGREPDLLQPITLHECRHTFASLLIDAGVNPKAIQEFMGHATIEETFSRYGHLMPGTRNQARELVDAYMDVATAAERVPRHRHERR